MKHIITIFKHEHLRYWRDGKFLLVSAFAALLFYLLHDSPVRYLLLAALHARAPDITQYIEQIHEIFIYDYFVVFFPLLTLLLAYNAVSQDTSTGSIRFLLPRVKRYEYLVGKFLSLSIYVLLLLSVSFIGLGLLTKVGFINLFPLFVFCLAFGLVWLSIYFLMSAILSRPMLVILLGLFLPVLMLVLAFAPGISWASPFSMFVVNLGTGTLLFHSFFLMLENLIYVALTVAVFEVRNL
ncbi:ABC transporter permease subunit [Candidatus Woesearchaeota archaeon]|nr:ABC transporter permease subunit [Candidatus Woesearchaeota archaeon]